MLVKYALHVAKCSLSILWQYGIVEHPGETLDKTSVGLEGKKVKRKVTQQTKLSGE
jgi:hypothetical protein